MLSPNHHMESTWISTRPDLTLAQILHATATGGVRADCDSRMLEMLITAQSIAVSEIEILIPDAIDQLLVPARHGNEGPAHRNLRRLGLVLAKAIDPHAGVSLEHWVPCGSAHALIDIFAETRHGRIAIECGTRDGRDIPRLLKASADHVVILPFAGWQGSRFNALGFSNQHARPLPRITYTAMVAALEMQDLDAINTI
ncbi:hypothetical protein [Magnetospirillum sp. ME-1]|uniref:Uncharacterized protein n=2 Tax=Paramagnetospirillum magneticum TaxID=84159 RepID=Q2W8I3_PARM1|nr:hypothetical protein [Magnetospirillum sp. ME-1]BAE49842.1 hypothetical protein amb1038 [Paramagnetospirillum magneticum AMB-1]